MVNKTFDVFDLASEESLESRDSILRQDHVCITKLNNLKNSLLITMNNFQNEITLNFDKFIARMSSQIV